MALFASIDMVNTTCNVINSTFDGNSSPGTGGALYIGNPVIGVPVPTIWSLSNVNIEHVVFNNNKALLGGAFELNLYAVSQKNITRQISVSISKAVFTNNTVDELGGGYTFYIPRYMSWCKQ